MMFTSWGKYISTYQNNKYTLISTKNLSNMRTTSLKNMLALNYFSPPQLKSSRINKNV